MKGLEELKQIASKLTGSYIILKRSCSCPLNAELIAFLHVQEQLKSCIKGRHKKEFH